MKKSREITRRGVLAAAPAVGAAAASAGAAEAAEQDVERDDDPRRVELRDTTHIRTYYDLCRK
ncbi:hypothetical protein [Tranquillimonas alkanivorans]|uniref:Formate dehydrogenase region TAT target n=1 Tax=Tranquillimonas alkanivorans TaxID=441119 RepID=A0A1I5QDP0_9RHOB|nr:hypothetical protein [Tranquillimonas alkanivorans]SFP44385.1 formate dehydrogenase region TAT target [Tranquillimonas alkanivorans]